ncbi:Uncharacterised protein [Lysinibacillus capsici]|uniref:Acb2/Tad1 hairpin domain-containing protein n=1 Tax=Lysinibacillus capsici TaxID=2115968 RepID=A0A2X0XPA0_9BACI|nr:hypothetical protein [Lysinibacillus capsici]SPT95568.1 Uncharacterised protein [Lysinibacillus capsici]
MTNKGGEIGCQHLKKLKIFFMYHSPKADQPKRYDAIRTKAKELALLINEVCPESREKALALTNLQQTTMWANASIAINEGCDEHEN